MVNASAFFITYLLSEPTSTMGRDSLSSAETHAYIRQEDMQNDIR